MHAHLHSYAQPLENKLQWLLSCTHIYTLAHACTSTLHWIHCTDYSLMHAHPHWSQLLCTKYTLMHAHLHTPQWLTSCIFCGCMAVSETLECGSGETDGEGNLVCGVGLKLVLDSTLVHNKRFGTERRRDQWLRWGIMASANSASRHKQVPDALKRLVH